MHHQNQTDDDIQIEADAVGTTQSVISQLESADYEGHSLSMLGRIAKAFNRRVEIRLAPLEPVS